jgi:hypothetical protein
VCSTNLLLNISSYVSTSTTCTHGKTSHHYQIIRLVALTHGLQTLKHQWAAAISSLFFLGSIGRNEQ